MTEFQRNLPEGFHERLSSKVITISERKRTKNRETIRTFNTDLIFPRVVYFLSMDQFDFFLSLIMNLHQYQPHIKTWCSCD